MNIAVLAGGISTERDVSLKSGAMVAEALRSKGHRVIVLDVFLGLEGLAPELAENAFENLDQLQQASINAIPSEAPDLAAVRASRADQSDEFFGENVLRICKQADIVFMALHGENGENGKVQAALDLHGIKYTGNDYLGSALAMNKDLAKGIMLDFGIPCPEGFGLKKSADAEGTYPAPDCYPCVVKPTCGGSSIGVSIANNEAEYKAALSDAFACEDEVVVESYIQGREFSVGVINGKALPVIEIAPIEGFYDYKNKYKAGSAVETCPADLPTEVSLKMQAYAEQVMKALRLDVYARMDFMLNEKGEMFCLEANTLPGMTPTSLLPQEAAAVGMAFPELCEEIIKISMKKYEV